MKFEIPNYVSVLMDTLEKAGYECYIVGGAVRNLLLGLPVHDYDVTTNATPDQMQSIFSSYNTITTGLKHGTLTIISNHQPVEITTYRKDAEYKDHRHPDAVYFTTAIQEDCARRDFTINAFCYNQQGQLLDFFHGQEDLKNHRIRCIGDANKRFEEDSLRILRAIRFSTQLHFTIEENTKQAIFTNKQLLSYVSMERIHDEWVRILEADSCASTIQTYQEVFATFLPEISSVVQQEVWNAIDASKPRHQIRMAILLQNCNTVHSVLKRMKYSGADCKEILSYIQYRNETVVDRISMKKLMSVYPESFELYMNFRSAIDSTFSLREMQSLYMDILTKKECTSLSDLEIKGNDLIQLGYKGSEISKGLHQLLITVIENKVLNQKEKLIDYLKRENQ